ncbi:uncharacterized protein FIBRA_08809 [Fibroporia radiculosa]|uniref:Uncharacterized protein n=1 Tax=Fibroporia radiculosa TaxID=599839 RepID=J4ICJ8_9APHY|nr:uncharacterized protein FIBRA_08809 [Fibroporia radiculosa]CCM06536.1 predicted protein [Fibroporia radiculosa]
MAHFRFMLAKYYPVPQVYMQAGYPNSVQRAAMIAHIALSVYIEDVKQLVAFGVRRAIKSVTPAILESMSPSDRQHHELRLTRLDQWLKVDNPLSHEKGVYATITSAICEHSLDIAQGLPAPDDNDTTQREFATALYGMTKPHHPHTLGAPLISRGGSIAVLQAAVELIHAYVPPALEGLQHEQWCIDVLLIAARGLQICYVPWSPPNPQGAGRRSSKVVWNYWKNVSKADRSPRPTLIDQIEHAFALGPSQRGKEAAFNAAMASSQSPWDVASIRLSELGHYLNRQVLPTEMKFSYANIAQQDTGYCSQTYRWVLAHFDFGKPLHQLALICGIVMSKVAPNVFYTTQDDPLHIPPTMTPDEVTSFIVDAPWITNTTRKGAKDGGPFVIMFTVLIISLLEPASPLYRQYVATGKRHGLGGAWTKKHSAKGITSFNLIRMGIANALTSKQVKGSLFHIDWEFKPTPVLHEYHQQLTELFRNGEHGAYDAVSLLVGCEMANTLVKRGELKRRSGVPILTNPTGIPLSNPLLPGLSSNRISQRKHQLKRSMSLAAYGDDPFALDEPRPSQRRRASALHTTRHDMDFM